MSWAYGLVVRIRNAMYGQGRGVRRVSLPVISVGNVTVGGTGKTPLVTWIVRRLRESGHRPAIVMRGYASVDPSKADEVVEYHEQFQEIDIVVGGDRYANITSYLSNGGQADCFVMDDGFQHRRLHRDLDIVVLDFLRDALEERMLPAGWLREPIEGLKRADAFVVSHTSHKNPAYAERVASVSGKKPIAWTSHHWTKLQVHAIEGKRSEELDWLMGKNVAVRLGIGYPGPVVEALVRLGAKISLQLPAGDHQPFSDSEIEMLIQASKEVDAVVMTLKDWVKARDVIDLTQLQCPIVVPNLVLEIVDGDKELESLLLSVFK
ncbi:MAG TPA: tetraacyldisaccharide 4'-kinase [Phycisphaerales bacterium]|jgi:tetraacyldisaccharide 4'-kinase|nr:tetraacyldisaccharide 4'-kinase [Phycisphaerales bacterium]